jgi:hypothetical protein
MELSKINIAKGILAYYWGGIALLNLDLPTFVSQQMQTWITFTTLGFIIAHYTNNFEELEQFYMEKLEFLNTMVKGPKVLTNWGAFNWDGTLYKESIEGDTYCIFREGVNFMGMINSGERVFICPQDHVVEVGKHRLLKTDFEWTKLREIPYQLQPYTDSATWIFKGDVVSPIFEQPSPESIDLARQNKNQISFSNDLIRLNKEYQKLVSDAMMNMKNMQQKQSNGEDEDYGKLIQVIDSRQQQPGVVQQ